MNSPVNFVEVSKKTAKAVYKIENVQTQRSYIGASGNVNKRVASHKKALAAGRHPCKDLQSDWVKFGSDNFKFLVLQDVRGDEPLWEIEQDWILRHGGVDGQTTYNRSRALRGVNPGSSDVCHLCLGALSKNGWRDGRQLWTGHVKGCSIGRPMIEEKPLTQWGKIDRHRQSRGVIPRQCRYAVWVNGIRVGTVEARSVFGARKLSGAGTEVKLIPRRDWENELSDT